MIFPAVSPATRPPVSLRLHERITTDYTPLIDRFPPRAAALFSADATPGRFSRLAG